MESELLEKMNNLMYFLVKDAARQSFSEFLEDLDISHDEYEEIKAEWKKIGISKTYI